MEHSEGKGVDEVPMVEDSISRSHSPASPGLEPLGDSTELRDFVSEVEMLREVSKDIVEFVACGLFPERNQTIHALFEGICVFLIIRECWHF